MAYNEKLFIWDGIMEVDGGTKNAVWHGTVTAETAMDATRVEAPHRNAFKEFCDSDMQFRVTGAAQPLDGVKDDNRFKPHRLNWTGGEGWDLDGRKHQDSEHELLLERLQWQGSPDQRDSLVYAKGRDEYGPFISVGWMRPVSACSYDVSYRKSPVYMVYMRSMSVVCGEKNEKRDSQLSQKASLVSSTGQPHHARTSTRQSFGSSLQLEHQDGS